ncbi:unnamed protein product [Dracunculus medinensis]|uniref:G-protein coupled receptors family 1 profile domain-containing protein n=1 Tax=Dracunculus medinensis TaxID=318479 RepID=A0A3P7T0X9_DRAME|nr:unnamed protein product [Dracunculus medinensis]
MELVYRIYFGWLPLPLTVIALLCAIFYIFIVSRVIRSKRIGRKCYVILINRTIGDILGCITALTTSFYVLISKHPNRDIVSLLELFFVASFWSGMISYVSISLLKLYAVWKPIDYREKITMKRCIYLISLSWIIFALMVVYTLTVTALTKIPVLNEWSGCKLETCQMSMYRFRNSITVAVYLFTIFVFAITVTLLKKEQKTINSFRSNGDISTKGPRFPLYKLALNVATFGGLNIFYVIWCISMNVTHDGCFYQRNFSEMQLILAFVRCTLLLRIFVDPVISFIVDSHVCHLIILLNSFCFRDN